MLSCAKKSRPSTPKILRAKWLAHPARLMGAFQRGHFRLHLQVDLAEPHMQSETTVFVSCDSLSFELKSDLSSLMVMNF
jgi:hypothetical protein